MTASHGMLTHCCPDHLTMQKLVERALPGGFPATVLFTFLALGEGRVWVSALQWEGLERLQLGLPRGGGESWGSPGLLPRSPFLAIPFLQIFHLSWQTHHGPRQGQMVRKPGSQASSLSFRHLFGQGLHLETFLNFGCPRARGLSLCTVTHLPRDTGALGVGSLALGPSMLSHTLGHLWATQPLPRLPFAVL